VLPQLRSRHLAQAMFIEGYFLWKP
jgi:hypothetical protein